MDKLEYHLLYLLSQPPVSRFHKKFLGWNAGDILYAERNDAFQRTDRFVVLDISSQGRAMALKISKASTPLEMEEEYLDIGCNGLNILKLEAESGNGSQAAMA
jgi:hypothetical protein